MKRFLMVCFVALVAFSSMDAEARGWFRRGGGGSHCSVPAGCSNATAQGVAEACAKIGRLCHMGGHAGMYEGLGMGSTKESAYNACCFARSGMQTVDVGYAQMRNGMWVAARRYRR